MLGFDPGEDRAQAPRAVASRRRGLACDFMMMPDRRDPTHQRRNRGAALYLVCDEDRDLFGGRGQGREIVR